MAGGSRRRTVSRQRTVAGLVRDTQKAMEDVHDILHIEPEIYTRVSEIGDRVSSPTALVVLGRNPECQVRVVHCLLGHKLLPDILPKQRRWIRIKFGSSPQVALSLGNSEFELVEELQSHTTTWDVIPHEDLVRSESTDFATILEIEVNNQLLKEGLQILLPPDLGISESDQNLPLLELKEKYIDIYTKRESILKNFNAVYLFALDRIGEECFKQNMYFGRSPFLREDFWSCYSLYYLNRIESEIQREGEIEERVEEREVENCVLNSKNCLDLYQVKCMCRASQVQFVLLGGGEGGSERGGGGGGGERTESGTHYHDELPEDDRNHSVSLDNSTPCNRAVDRRRLLEEQCAFMGELLEQWENTTSIPPKYSVKSQYVIIDEESLLSITDQKGSLTTSTKVGCKEQETLSRGCTDKMATSRTNLITKISKFVFDTVNTYLLEYSTILSEIHVQILQQFILTSFDLARELQVIPKKVHYVATQEQHLYQVITEKFTRGEKKQELVKIMADVLQEMRDDLQNMDWTIDDLPCHRDWELLSSRRSYSTSGVGDDTVQSGVEGGESVEGEGEAWELTEQLLEDSGGEHYSPWTQIERAPSELSSYQMSSIRIETESRVFTVKADQVSPRCRYSNRISTKQAALDVQKTVLNKLSHKISSKLVDYIDCLRDSYFGTLQRCVSELEWCSGREELSVGLSSLTAPPPLPAPPAPLSRILISLLRRIFPSSASSSCCPLSAKWRRHHALLYLDDITPHTLARLISKQMVSRVESAHERFQTGLASVETALHARLTHTEDVKIAIRRKYAPSFACLCLESTSMCDRLKYGMPELGKEIGRGQYGVVYGVRGRWGRWSKVAAKSVIPHLERHYHDLAMEVYYTRSIPPHRNVVPLVGSVVEGGWGAGGGGPPTVVVLSPRRTRDLHTAVAQGVSYVTRLRVAIDIVTGIRYLHSLGLVHRDVKLKNVLLDQCDVAALADFGFCTAGALLAGSLVGTPVHMAPDLFSGDYNASVDVYAFGILFWYLCSNSVKLPANFEALHNKEQLWDKVRKGLRPERLPVFSAVEWGMMESCWAGEPSRRPLLGTVHQQLIELYTLAGGDLALLTT